jgi:glutamate dehydrogenase
VLAEARVVVQDYHPMLRRLRVVEEELGEHMQEAETPESREEFQEALAFAAWLRRANFVFLGYRGYDIKTPRGKGPSAEPVIEIEHGSGLGILRDEESSTFYQPTPFATLPKEQTERITGAHVVLVHKANSDSHVLRRARMDYIGFKKLDAQGKVAGEHRFLGLFTARAYNDLPSDIPILRKKLERVFAKANVVPGSHDHKEIFSIFTSIPKYELFMTDEDRIAEMIFSILSSAGRRDVKISYRPDFLEQGVSAMVLLPKDKFNAGVRVAIQKLLAEELPGTPVEYRLALSEEPLARLHFYFLEAARQSALPSVDALETKVAELIRTWPERLADALVREHGTEAGEALGHRYAGAFPAAYIAVKSPETAVADVREAERALQEDTITVSIASVRLQGKKVSVLKFFRPREASTLSQLMPVLTPSRSARDRGAGLPHRTRARGAGKPGDEEVYLHSFRVTYPDGQPLPQGLISRRIEETIRASWPARAMTTR